MKVLYKNKVGSLTSLPTSIYYEFVLSSSDVLTYEN